MLTSIQQDNRMNEICHRLDVDFDIIKKVLSMVCCSSGVDEISTNVDFNPMNHPFW